METKIKGIRDGGSGEEVTIKSTKHGDMLASQYLPYGTLLTAKGESWQIITTTNVACLVVRPGTVAHLTMWNGEAAGGKSYIIERVFAHALTTTNVQAFFHLWLCVHDVGMAAVTSQLTAVANNRCVANYGGNALFELGATVNDDGWFPWGPTCEIEATGTLPGSMVSAEINGRIIIPPTAGLSIAPVASLIGDLAVVGVHWYEETIDLG